jgi:4-alpha-glucanotransferase
LKARKQASSLCGDKQTRKRMKKRGSGILLHITSLPDSYGIGDFGPEAYRFVDFLAQTKQSYWQILPLNPIDPAFGSSPYHSNSAFGHNTLFISPELMIKKGLLHNSDFEPLPRFLQGRVDYPAVIAYKRKLFDRAFELFQTKKKEEEYTRFCAENAYWIDDFALFVAFKDHLQGKIWSDWPPEIRDRNPGAIDSVKKEMYQVIEREKFLQYLFIQQWAALREYCHKKGIRIIGDMPIYVDYDSVDCWTHPDLFKLDKEKRPYAVAGVPPDYFSATGQLWGNPLYRWDVLRQRGYDWWIKRMEHNLKIFDLVRVDHFRGFVGYWEVPAAEESALNGRWVEAPAFDFFLHLKERFPDLPLIAEDLGVITPDVRKVMGHFGFPGMKILLFAFGEDNPMHPYLPHTYEKNCVVYTGTHDNNTVRGWFDKEARPDERRRVFNYLGREVPVQDIHWELIKLAMISVANAVIIPMQDVLGLGQEARMNRPATTTGNWQWRLLPDQLSSSSADKLGKITEIYGRAQE